MKKSGSRQHKTPIYHPPRGLSNAPSHFRVMTPLQIGNRQDTRHGLWSVGLWLVGKRKKEWPLFRSHPRFPTAHRPLLRPPTPSPSPPKIQNHKSKIQNSLDALLPAWYNFLTPRLPRRKQQFRPLPNSLARGHPFPTQAQRIPHKPDSSTTPPHLRTIRERNTPTTAR